MKIFVQIAAYRDPELLPTIRHCIERAKYPENLTFGICWQRAEDESLEEIENDSRFKIVKVPYSESKGACWARSKTNELYNKEDFTLQIDSHMRFIQNWDDVLVKMWKELNDPKAVFTAYPPQYEPLQKEDEWKNIPHICNVYSFKDGQTQQRPDSPADFLRKKTPYRAVHIAAGFVFGPGSIIEHVPYDPQFYFCGEESALTVRLFTHGYNLYHPHKTIIYHYYERKNEVKHWDDDTNWGQYTNTTTERLNCLLQRNTKFNLGKYGLGNKRTLEDFQNYSGIDYKRNIVHTDTIAGKEPPVDLSDETKWSYTLKHFSRTIGWIYDRIDKCDDPRFWAFIFKDQNDQELFREDVSFKDYSDIILGKINERKFEFSYYYPSQVPTTFIIWPYSESKQWLTNKTWKIPQI